jgi:acyl-coenzyme A thioesterase PaaI-like protein
VNKQPNSHNCFICGVQNIAGVHVAFYEALTPDGELEVLARFTGCPHHQGYPQRMHGGVAAGILDETIGRAINTGEAGLQPMTWGVTVEIDVRYHQPVPLNVELTAHGRITQDRGRLYMGTGEIYLPDGTVAVSAVGKYVKLKLGEIAGARPEALGWQVYPD